MRRSSGLGFGRTLVQRNWASCGDTDRETAHQVSSLRGGYRWKTKSKNTTEGVASHLSPSPSDGNPFPQAPPIMVALRAKGSLSHTAKHGGRSRGRGGPVVSPWSVL